MILFGVWIWFVQLSVVKLFIGVPAAVVNPGEDGQHGGGEPCGGPLAQAVAVREVNAPKNNLLRN